MRELEFRQKIKEDAAKRIGPYHYWGYIDGGFTSPLGKNDTVSDSEQYTGLKDTNGVKIFERDILYVAGIGNCVVGFDVGFSGFTIESVGHIEGIAHSLEDIERVIGNIYETPELLK